MLRTGRSKAAAELQRGGSETRRSKKGSAGGVLSIPPSSASSSVFQSPMRFFCGWRSDAVKAGGWAWSIVLARREQLPCEGSVLTILFAPSAKTLLIARRRTNVKLRSVHSMSGAAPARR